MSPLGIKRDEQGNRLGGFEKLEEVDGKTTLNPVRPTSPNLPGTKLRVFECTLCADEGTYKRYKKAAILANHFKRSHSSEYESKDSWREYSREILIDAR